jgi:hypothetical protein
MDFDKIKSDYINLTADSILEKDISKYVPIIKENLKIIDQFLTDNMDDPDNPQCHHLMVMGYWFYKTLDKGMY